MQTLHPSPRDKMCWSSLGVRLVPRPPDRKMDPDGRLCITRASGLHLRHNLTLISISLTTHASITSSQISITPALLFATTCRANACNVHFTSSPLASWQMPDSCAPTIFLLSNFHVALYAVMISSPRSILWRLSQ